MNALLVRPAVAPRAAVPAAIADLHRQFALTARRADALADRERAQAEQAQENAARVRFQLD